MHLRPYLPALVALVGAVLVVVAAFTVNATAGLLAAGIALLGIAAAGNRA